MNYEQELNNLRNAQKNAAMADLQSTRDSALSNLQAEEARIRPEYASQRSTANANNRVAARNFQEYLANTGRANSGIGAQYEMSRQNSLQNGLNAINAAEAQSLADIARRRSDAQNAYNTGLAGANAQVEANYIKNLLDQQQQQWERNFAQKQFDESVRQYNLNRQDALNNRAFSSGGGSGSRSSSSSRSSSKSSSNSNKMKYTDLPNAVASAVANVSAMVNGKGTTPVANNTSSNNYNIKSVTSPSSFSSQAAKNWYINNAQRVATKAQLDNVIAQGLRSGSITQTDANNIYKSYGI